ncbi:hypothetical protein BH10BAC2_BH10BAC2_04490 [soil metagenome]
MKGKCPAHKKSTDLFTELSSSKLKYNRKPARIYFIQSTLIISLVITYLNKVVPHLKRIYDTGNVKSDPIICHT